MTKTFELGATRLNETLTSVLAWAKANKWWGMGNSLFICENGRLEEYFDVKEGEKFHNNIKNMTEEKFNEICDEFIKSIEEKDLFKMMKSLIIFDEIDYHPEFVTKDNLRRLERIRKSTQEQEYELGNNNKIKNFIVFKGEIYEKNKTKNL